jgi:hypothetical protein
VESNATELGSTGQGAGPDLCPSPRQAAFAESPCGVSSSAATGLVSGAMVTMPRNRSKWHGALESPLYVESFFPLTELGQPSGECERR